MNWLSSNLLIMILLLGFATKSWGQACCSGGVPLSSGINLNYTNPNMLQIQSTWDYNNLNTVMDGTTILEDQTRRRSVNSLMLEGAYQFSKRLSGAFMFSAVWQYREIYTNGSVQNSTLASGLGDAIFMGRYLVVAGHNWEIGLEAGAKMPLGAYDRTTDAGISLPADMQPGTGSWDGIFGANLIAQNLLAPGWSIQLSSTYHSTGTNPNFRNSQAYDFGDNWITTMGVGKEWLIGKSLVDVTIGGSARYMTYDAIDNNFIPNTGGWWFNGIGSVSYYFNPDIRLSAGVTLPVYRILEGTQLTTSNTAFIRLYWKFSLKRSRL